MAKKIPVAPKSKAAESDSDDGANDQSQELADLMAGVKLDGGSQKDCSICQTSHTQEGKLCEE